MGRLVSGERFPRTARITCDRRALELRAAARRRGRWFVVRRLDNGVGYPRVLIRVGKQVMASAVARNRMKRCVREVFRQQRVGLAGIDYFVSLVQPYPEKSLMPARRELERLLATAER